jgi:hypothetical protein
MVAAFRALALTRDCASAIVGKMQSKTRTRGDAGTVRSPRRGALIPWFAVTAVWAGALALGCGAFSSSSDAPAVTPPIESGADVGAPPGADASPVSDAGTDSNVADAGADAATHLVAFVTAATYPNITTATIADTKCNEAASGVLPGRFRAWFSTPTTGALARLTGLGLDGPWYRPDGARIVANAAALGNADVVPLENPIRIDASGAVQAGNAWTGTFANGAPGVLCPNVDPTKGDITKIDGQWTRLEAFVALCTTGFRLYCFQIE